MTVKLIVRNMVRLKQLNKKYSEAEFDHKHYTSILVGSIQRSGNRRRAVKIVSNLYLKIHTKFKLSPYRYFETILDSCRPRVQLTPKKIAGITYKIPTPISYRKSLIIAIHWIVVSASKRKGKSFTKRLIDEFEEVYSNPISAVSKKRDEVHKAAHLNKPFLRYIRI